MTALDVPVPGNHLGQHFHERRRRLHGIAYMWCRNHPQADDLVQEVFVTFLNGLDRFEGRAEVRTWLFGILHHKIQERRRMQAREELHDSIDEIFESRFDARGNWTRPPVEPDREAASREAGAAIRDCLDGLSPLQRAVFQLRQVEDLSAAEVGKILGQTITHVGVLLHRARTRLRACLDGKGWTSIP